MTATLKEVSKFFSTDARPVKMSELKELTIEDKAELRELVGIEIGK